MTTSVRPSVLEKHESGVPGFDALTGGGFPKGRATLLTGRSGVGKTILALQLSANLARRGEHVVYFGVEENPGDLRATAEGLGLSADSDGIRFVDARRDERVAVTGEYDTSGLVARIEAEAKRNGARTVVIDSLSALFRPKPSDGGLREHLFALLRGLTDRGFTVVATSEAHSDYAPPTVLGAEDFVCDLVVVLRNVVDGKRRRRTVEIHKYRRSGHRKGEYACTITGDGMRIFPLDPPGVAAFSQEPERFSSGMQGLDEMNAGGWLRDSIVLVRGPSGSGKTTMAGMYARAGASRGERVVYYGFEEPYPVLLRNFRSVAMPMDEHEASGNLRFVCKYPEATSPEDLLVDLARDLDEIDPTLIVLDSISSVEHSSSTEGFRIFLIGLASLLRIRGRSALLTQTISSQTEARQDPPFLSTVADAILMLDYTADAPQLERTMRVLKMRGSAHATDQRRLVIGGGGLRVERVD